MFSRQHWQIKLVYASFGALILFIGMLLSPVAAQRDKFGEIECTSLAVVDADGKTVVRLGVGEHGGRVYAYGKAGKSGAALGVDEHGKGVVKVAVYDAIKNGLKEQSMTRLKADYSRFAMIRAQPSVSNKERGLMKIWKWLVLLVLCFPVFAVAQTSLTPLPVGNVAFGVGIHSNPGKIIGAVEYGLTDVSKVVIETWVSLARSK